MGEYTLNGQKFTAKKRYKLKEWSKILLLLNGFNTNEPMEGVITLLAGDNLEKMLELILSDYTGEDLYEDDFEEVGRIISDFFSRKNGLINTGVTFS